MDSLLIASLMFPLMFLLLVIGLPVALALFIPALLAGYAVFGEQVFTQAYGGLFTTATNYVLAAVPMFILMGALLERSGIAARLFGALRIVLKGLPGGLAIATIAMGAIFAAAAGVVGAVEVMVGMMAIPAMQAAKYKNSLIAGTICAGGSLGTMIPPSIVAIVYAALAQISVGEIFAAMLLPGLVMVGLFVLYILAIGLLYPEQVGRHAPHPGGTTDAADPPTETQEASGESLLSVLLHGLLPPLALIVVVLGSILAGVASPTEAAAMGALGAALLCLVYGRLNLAIVTEALKITARITSMIMLIVAGGILFTSGFMANGGASLIKSLIALFGFERTGTLAFFLVIIFILGFVLDWTANVLITVPLFLPFLAAYNVDPIWFGTLVVIVIQAGYLTPPMASSIFYLLSIAPPDMKYRDICLGVIPYIGAQLITLLLVASMPFLATWLPSRIVGF